MEFYAATCGPDEQRPLNYGNGIFAFGVGAVFILALFAMPALAIAGGHAHFEPQEPRYN